MGLPKALAGSNGGTYPGWERGTDSVVQYSATAPLSSIPERSLEGDLYVPRPSMLAVAGSKVFRRAVPGLIISLLSLAFAGCGGSGRNLDGLYHGVTGGPITISIKGAKATVQVANESKTLDYKVEGNKLTILNPGEGDIVFTINDDGTLNGELGMMTKKPL